MCTTRFTNHAILRFAQRGLRMDDADLAIAVGTQVDDGYLVTGKDIHSLEKDLKAFLDRLRRLEGTRFVILGNDVITAYRPNRRHQKQIIRSAAA